MSIHPPPELGQAQPSRLSSTLDHVAVSPCLARLRQSSCRAATHLEHTNSARSKPSIFQRQNFRSHRAFHLPQNTVRCPQFPARDQPGEHVSSGNVHIGDRFRGNDQPFRWLRRLCDTPSHLLAKICAFAKKSGASSESAEGRGADITRLSEQPRRLCVDRSSRGRPPFDVSYEGASTLDLSGTFSRRAALRPDSPDRCSPASKHGLGQRGYPPAFRPRGRAPASTLPHSCPIALPYADRQWRCSPAGS